MEISIKDEEGIKKFLEAVQAGETTEDAERVFELIMLANIAVGIDKIKMKLNEKK